MKLLKFGVGQAFILAVSAVVLIPSTALLAGEQGNNKKASLSLKATPAVAFAPARIVLVSELKGGSDDSEELYCPTVEWEWGDLTTSNVEQDCEPYEAGKSTIKRRYTVEHQFKNPGSFKIVLRLKKGQKIVATANTSITVRAGLGQEPGQ
jgi:hypothetical protein